MLSPTLEEVVTSTLHTLHEEGHFIVLKIEEMKLTEDHTFFVHGFETFKMRICYVEQTVECLRCTAFLEEDKRV